MDIFFNDQAIMKNVKLKAKIDACTHTHTRGYMGKYNGSFCREGMQLYVTKGVSPACLQNSLALRRQCHAPLNPACQASVCPKLFTAFWIDLVSATILLTAAMSKLSGIGTRIANLLLASSYIADSSFRQFSTWSFVIVG